MPIIDPKADNTEELRKQFAHLVLLAAPEEKDSTATKQIK
jgi:hypothetical protein